MKKILLLSIIFITKLNVNAQTTFQKAYGGLAMDEAKSVRQTTDGGYIIAGTTTSYGSGGRDVLVIKTDAKGDTTWTKTFGGDTDNEYGFCVQQTTDSGYIISGVASSFADVAGDMYLIKLTATGDTMWTRTYGGIGYEWGSFVQQTSDGGYIIIGQTPAFGAGGFDAYLVKTDATGNLSWTKTYGGTGLEVGSAVQQTTDGGYIFTGEIDTYGAGGGDFYLVKTDSTGIVVWTKTFGTPGTEAGVTIKQTTDGGYIIGGTSENSLGPLGPDMCLIKTNDVGDTLWTRLYGGPMIDECYEVIQTTDGGYMICGKSFSFSAAGDYDAYVVKTNSLGIVQWSKTYGSSTGNSSNDIAYSVSQTNDGGYIVAGESLFGFGVGLKNAYLLKTDSLGNSGCNEGIAATITSMYAPFVSSPPTLTSLGGVITYPATILNSGTIQTNLCFTSSITKKTSFENFNTFPNPFTSTVTLEINLSEKQNIGIAIVDVFGNIVRNFSLDNINQNENKITFDLSELNNGIYFCEIKSNTTALKYKMIKIQ